MRRLHRDRQWHGHPLVRDAGERGGRQGDRDAGRPGNARKAASHPEGVHRRTGRAVRLLPQRRDPDGEGLSTRIPKPRRRRFSRRSPACCAVASTHTRMQRAIENQRYDRRAVRDEQPPHLFTRCAQARSISAAATRIFCKTDLEAAHYRWLLVWRDSEAAGAVRQCADSRISSRQRASRFLDRHRRRRQRHGLQRQGRTGPGHLHRAAAIGGRGAVRFLSSASS